MQLRKLSLVIGDEKPNIITDGGKVARLSLYCVIFNLGISDRKFDFILLGFSFGLDQLGVLGDRSVLIVHWDIVGLTRIVLAYC